SSDLRSLLLTTSTLITFSTSHSLQNLILVLFWLITHYARFTIVGSPLQDCIDRIQDIRPLALVRSRSSMIQELVRATVASVAAKLSRSDASRRINFLGEFLARDRVLMRAARCSAPIPLPDRFPPATREP